MNNSTDTVATHTNGHHVAYTRPSPENNALWVLILILVLAIATYIILQTCIPPYYTAGAVVECQRSDGMPEPPLQTATPVTDTDDSRLQYDVTFGLELRAAVIDRTEIKDLPWYQRSPQDANWRLSECLELTKVRGEKDLLAFNVTSGDPATSIALANAAAEVYVTHITADQQSAWEGYLTDLADIREKLQADQVALLAKIERPDYHAELSDMWRATPQFSALKEQKRSLIDAQARTEKVLAQLQAKQDDPATADVPPEAFATVERDLKDINRQLDLVDSDMAQIDYLLDQTAQKLREYESMQTKYRFNEGLIAQLDVSIEKLKPLATQTPLSLLALAEDAQMHYPTWRPLGLRVSAVVFVVALLGIGTVLAMAKFSDADDEPEVLTRR